MLATSGPGGVHLLNGIYDAKLDGQPVLAITGAQHHDLLTTLTQQDIELDKLFMDATACRREYGHGLAGDRRTRSRTELGHVLDMGRTHDPRRIAVASMNNLSSSMSCWVSVVEQIVVLRASDRQHRLAIELGVVDAVQQVDAAGTRGREANPELAGELGIGAGGECARFLVAYLDELDVVLALAQRFEHAD